MVSFRRPSGQATAVVLALAVRPATWRYGYELCQRLDLEAGTLYPALMRLADRGQLEPAWESEVPAARHATCTGSPVPAVCWQGELGAEPPAPPKVARVAGGVGRHPRLEGT